MYSTPDGKHCAFAYMCINPEDLSEGTSVYGLDITDEKQDILKEEYRGHSVHFYRDVQQFHDNIDNFTMEGLSEIGKLAVTTLKEAYNS